MAQETAEEELKSPRISWANGGVESGDVQQYADDLAAGVSNSLSGQQRIGHANGTGDNKMAARAQQDDLAVAQNGGLIAQDTTDDGEMDGEESDLDDDMMDKISSSPSIDDGGSFRQIPSFDSVRQNASSGSPPASPCFSEARSSSPYLDLPVYLPLQNITPQQTSTSTVESPNRHHHLPGAFPQDPDNQPNDDDAARRVMEKVRDQDNQEKGNPQERLNRLSRKTDTNLTMAIEETEEGSLLEQQSRRKASTDMGKANSDTEDGSDYDSGLVFPYEGSTDEDDDDSFSQSTNPDSRFIDSGWGGECLHDTEDIDFELVYALHTFIATVEGQANATKGDAMVLLDDSNSYWWLVRVVKDSSIGKRIPSMVFFPSLDCLSTPRLLAGRAHRNTNGTTRSSEQAQEH